MAGSSASATLPADSPRTGRQRALRAVTATAAYQFKDEKTKGTLETGKLADLVIRDRNPLEVERTAVRCSTDPHRTAVSVGPRLTRSRRRDPVESNSGSRREWFAWRARRTSGRHRTSRCPAPAPR